MSARVIQVRPSRNPRWQKQGGWQVFEAEGVHPVYCGPNGREQALSYARQRAGYGHAKKNLKRPQAWMPRLDRDVPMQMISITGLPPLWLPGSSRSFEEMKRQSKKTFWAA